MEKNKLYQIPIEALQYRNTFAISRFILIILCLLPIGGISWGFYKFLFWFIFIIVMSVMIQINLEYHNTSFLINDNELVVNYGIIVKHSKSIILSKIQNINVGQGMLEKSFGIKSIKIWTASQEQLHNQNKEIKIYPTVILHLKDDDIDSFKSLLNKI